MLILLRHAKAGSRKRYEGPDEHRPLTKQGRLQSVAIASTLAGHSIDRVVSSKYVRCVETVLPYAETHGLTVELEPALAEGSEDAVRVALLNESLDTNWVLCSHGDVLGSMLMALHAQGFPVDPNRCEKGSMWLIDPSADGEQRAIYVPPMAVEE